MDNNLTPGEQSALIRFFTIFLGIVFGCLFPVLVLITALRGGF